MFRNQIKKHMLLAFLICAYLIFSFNFPVLGDNQDEFTSSTLGSDWSWIRQDSTKWSLTARPGYMRIVCQPGEINGTNTSGKNILLKVAPSGDWTVMTKLDGKPGANWSQAGIMIYQDDNNYIKLNRLYDNGQKFQFAKETGGTYTYQNTADSIASSVSYLKIVKTGSSYSGYYSADGVTYTQVGAAQSINLSSIKAGLYSFGGPAFNADFDYFHLDDGTTPTPTPTPTPEPSGDVHSGTWGAKAYFNDSTPGWAKLYQTVGSLQTNTTYQASFWMKGTGSLGIKVMNTSWSTTFIQTNFNATSTWTKYTTTFNTGSNTSVIFMVDEVSSKQGTAYFDDCFLGLAGGANKLANPGFESGNVSWTKGGDASVYTIFQSSGQTPTPTPTPTTSPTPPPGDRVIPLVERSGLDHNSIVFRDNGSVTSAEEFGNLRDRPVDGMLFFAPRQTWNDLRTGLNSTHAAWLNNTGLIIYSVPHAPMSEGTSMNAKGANNQYQTQQRDFGAWLAANGFNSPRLVLRVDWEANGNWYPWSIQNGGAEVFKQSLINFVTNVRAGGATQVKFDLCFNKGPSQSGADFAVFPGKEYIDIIGIDQYDYWGPSFNATQWQNELDKTPSIESVAEFAMANDIMWAVDECGVTNPYTAGISGGDNPYYFHALWDTIHRPGYIERMAWFNTYDDPGAPASLNHKLTDGSNPHAWQAYLSHWGGQ